MSDGPLPAILAPLTIPASWAYRSVMAARNARFDRGAGVKRIDRPVISVGNLTTGGTGKSPMVAWLVDQLRRGGHHPVIAMRGYGASGDQPSDEQAEYAHRLPGVPVLANPDRLAALRDFLPAHPEVDCVVLDDGFQHRRIKRDLDLVLIDAGRSTLEDRLLPAGHLREPPGSLRRADAVIITHAQEVDARLAEAVARHHGRPPLAWTRHRWTHLNVQDRSAAARIAPVEELRGRRVLTMLGIGKPRSVIDQLEASGATVAVNIPASDHERYERAKLTMVRGLAETCDAMVLTGKDWVKVQSLIDLAAWSVPILVPQVAIELLAGETQLRQRALEVVGRAATTATASGPAR